MRMLHPYSSFWKALGALGWQVGLRRRPTLCPLQPTPRRLLSRTLGYSPPPCFVLTPSLLLNKTRGRYARPPSFHDDPFSFLLAEGDAKGGWGGSQCLDTDLAPWPLSQSSVPRPFLCRCPLSVCLSPSRSKAATRIRPEVTQITPNNTTGFKK